ncbi:MAG: hypothetical protein AB3N23_03550 [Paracoccaceae bacterium]
MVDEQNEQVLAELSQREPIFHRREFGTSRAALEAMTDPAFHDIGASGRIYSRLEVIETCLARYAAGPEPHDWPCSDFTLRCIGPNLFLLNYTLREPDRVTRRSTIWRREAHGWMIVFHQGTVVE